MDFMSEFIIGKVFKALDGYKVYLGGLGLIMVGVVGLIGHFYPDTGLKGMDIDSAMQSISLGVVTIGGRHTAKKITGV